jgi:S1-C subfamily serine protease
MSPQLRNQFSVPIGHGTLVAHVYDGSPAGEGGVQVGDVILSFAGQDVKDSVHLQNVVEQLEVGKSYPMAVLRNGEQVELHVTLREMPNDFSLARSRSQESEAAPPESEEFNELGLEIGPMSDETAQRLGIDGEVPGVVVMSVDENGPAAQQGIRTGDVIQRVGNVEITSPEVFEEAVGKMSLEEGVVMLVRSRQGTRFVVINSDN